MIGARTTHGESAPVTPLIHSERLPVGVNQGRFVDRNRWGIVERVQGALPAPR